MQNDQLELQHLVVKLFDGWFDEFLFYEVCRALLNALSAFNEIRVKYKYFTNNTLKAKF